jgi:hypothetical protein
LKPPNTASLPWNRKVTSQRIPAENLA